MAGKHEHTDTDTETSAGTLTEPGLRHPRVRQVIDQAQHVTNRPVPVTHGARRPGDCTKLVSGSLHAKTELGWSSDRSNLKQMITDAWRWHQTGGYTA